VAGSLGKRIWTAVVLVVVLLVTFFWLPPWCSVAVLTALALVGAWEWSGFLLLASPARRLAYVLLTAVLLWGAWWFSAVPARAELVLAVAVLWWLVALAWIVFAPRRVASWSAAGAGFLAIVPAWLALVRLRLAPQGAQWVVFVLVLVSLGDVGAFFSGRHFGRVRLAPQVSPGKTWEGVLGGMAVGAVVAVVGGWWFEVSLVSFVPLCLVVLALSVVGDLTESLLKRHAGLKDSGTILPGHGGVMDRIDSLTSASPALVLGLTLLGVVA
jgi:phosphatidate cytidylyltransferase